MSLAGKRPLVTPRFGLARVLSKRGLCSRTEAQRLIRAGLVRLDGRVICDPEFPVGDVHTARIDIENTVSYTHLDVYKRQVLGQHPVAHLQRGYCAGRVDGAVFGGGALLAGDDLEFVRLADPLQHDMVGSGAGTGRGKQLHGVTPVWGGVTIHDGGCSGDEDARNAVLLATPAMAAISCRDVGAGFVPDLSLIHI